MARVSTLRGRDALLPPVPQGQRPPGYTSTISGDLQLKGSTKGAGVKQEW